MEGATGQREETEKRGLLKLFALLGVQSQRVKEFEKKTKIFLQQHRPGASLSGQVGRQAEMAGQITCLLKREATGANHSQTGSQKVERPTLQRTSVEAWAGLPQRRETDPPASQNC